MKNLKMFVFAAALLPALALAEVRLAVVDPLQAMLQTSEAKNIIGGIEADMKSKEAEILRLRNEIMAIDERLKKEGMTMSDEQKKKLGDERDAKVLDFRSRGQLAQKRMEEEQKALLEKMEPKLRTALEAIAKEKKYDVIITRQAALFVKEEADITREVTQKINQMK